MYVAFARLVEPPRAYTYAFELASSNPSDSTSPLTAVYAPIVNIAFCVLSVIEPVAVMLLSGLTVKVIPLTVVVVAVTCNLFILLGRKIQ